METVTPVSNSIKCGFPLSLTSTVTGLTDELSPIAYSPSEWLSIVAVTVPVHFLVAALPLPCRLFGSCPCLHIFLKCPILPQLWHLALL